MALKSHWSRNRLLQCLLLAAFACPALEAACAILLGPYVRFVRPDAATVNWLTTATNSSIVEYGLTNSLGWRVEDSTPTTNHSVTINGIKPRTKYYFVIKEQINGQETGTELYDFESDYNFSVAPAASVPSPYPEDSMTAVYARVAQGILDQTGLVRGYCLDYGCGEGRLAYELARRSDLNIIGVTENAGSAARARQALQTAGLYGSRITITESSLSKLPHTKDAFNLIVSSEMLTATNCLGQSSEMFRVLRPGGGIAWIGYSAGTAGSLANWPALDAWIRAGISPSNASIQFDAGRSARIERKPLEGIGTWSHGYADPGNTACSRDERIIGTGMRLQWFGLPGPRGMIDRGCRNPQPLAVNGFLFVEGLNRLSAQDTYNGRIYWSLEIPKLIRVNIPRDTSNTCADETSVFVVVQDKCWRLDAYSGELTQYYALRPPNQSTNHHWGYVAVVTNCIYGSSMKKGASYTQYNGPAYWYDSLGTESTAKVCSDNLFCLSKANGQLLWTYTNGVIINSSIAIGGGRIYFAESRNITANRQTSGRITSASLWQNLYLVALDASTGMLAWERPLSVSVSPYPAVFFLSYTSEKLLLASSTSRFYLYAFDAQNGAPMWQKNHAWTRDNHGAHMYHPVIVGNTVYLEPYAYDTTTGTVIKSGLPARAGCSTMSAAGKMIHAVQLNYDNAAICLWDLATDHRRQMAGSRASCWMSIISADGMVLSPTASAGCTCQFPLQTSIGFAAP